MSHSMASPSISSHPHSVFPPRLFTAFLIIFTLSGFSGLIYQSIWTHYLKLFLGHAAYAQTLVLSIFMGGMAIGAWGVSRFIARIQNPLMVYALVEAGIGIFALIFHPVFNAFLGASYDTVMPEIGSVWGIHAYKWISGALLILPQSILLGATFPLMSEGLIRRMSHSSGRVLGLLYFTNSLGAAVGVLVNGFILVGSIGLPGSIAFAGCINIILALMVFVFSKQEIFSKATPIIIQKQSTVFDSSHSASSTFSNQTVSIPLVFTLVLLTGLSSFMYEIGWIRMLSLVLGSSTHSFEIMLSTFILGLAIGGFIIHRMADRFQNPLKALGIIQLVMGLCALLTLLFYKTQAFSGMSLYLTNIKRTEVTYLIFNIYSFLMSSMIMLPATICAGMVLPLVSHILYQKQGEGVIGRVYAWNTLGAILGVFLAVQWVMPLLGLKQVIVIGAAIDIFLGLFILWRWVPVQIFSIFNRMVYTLIGVVAVVFFSFFYRFNSELLASGIYRQGVFVNDMPVIFHKDGKTASVDVLQDASDPSYYAIKTNGKSDASLYIDESRFSEDEITMILAGVLPLEWMPDAKLIANIGFGSGLTVDTVLASEKIQHLDSIEIEPSIIEGARLFEKRVPRAFNDKRIQFHSEDAKTFFSQHNKKYDVIISEPSNPWVSGISSLFTDEFYRHIKRYLREDGLLVQWIQLYEINIELVASIMKAVNYHFDDYVIYRASSEDMIILAKPKGFLLKPSQTIYKNQNFREMLKRIQIPNDESLSLRMIGKKSLLGPLFDSFDIPMNSDYFPVIDQLAVKSRFLENSANDVIVLPLFPGVLHNLFQFDSQRKEMGFINAIALGDGVGLYSEFLFSKYILDYYQTGKINIPLNQLERQIYDSMGVIQSAEYFCDETFINHYWFSSVKGLLFRVGAVLSPESFKVIFDRISGMPCAKNLNTFNQQWLLLLQAINQQNDESVVSLVDHLFAAYPTQSQPHKVYLLSLKWLSQLNLNQPEKILHELPLAGVSASDSLMLRLIVSQMVTRLKMPQN